MKKWRRRVTWTLAAVALLAAAAYGFWPQPVGVDLGTVSRGPMRVTVDEEGKTRIREVYAVDAPLAGSLHRVRLRAGSPVAAGKTVLAVIEPGDPAFLNAAERAQAEARVKSTEAGRRQAEARVAVARKEYTLAASNLERTRNAHAARVASLEELHTVEAREQVRAEELRAAESAERVAAFEVELARAAFTRTSPKTALPPEDARLEIRAPIDGVVLTVARESAGVVGTGTPLLTVGDPADLELVIDVLSSDAVKVSPGNRVVVERWGGAESLEARVRLVEPAAELKVSALGVEEQRVKVIADFIDSPEKRRGLGHAYRVEARIVVWEAADVVKVPAGALFRGGDGEWLVFVVRDGVARVTPVRVGRSNGVEAEVLDRLAAGDAVVLHPGDQVRDKTRVVGR